MRSPEELADLLRQGGLDDAVDTLVPLLRPAIRLVATAAAPRPMCFRREPGGEVVVPEALEALEAALDALPLGASRFGGVPDLPPGAAWPARDGVPMEFVAQLDLAEAGPLDPERRLPTRGSLLFFYNSQWDTHDMVDEACCAVLFHDGDNATLVRATPPQVEWKSEYSDVPQVAPFLHGMATLALEPVLAAPGGVSPFVPEDIADDWQDFQAEVFEALAGPPPNNTLLGYADEQDYVDAHENGVDDQLLLQLDSDDAAEFQFGDCNKLFFLIHREALARRDFAATRVYSQLG
ncbi:MAG: DUF1963 domain-containing protein [Alphaproteobacteria bacterium]|nr:DUF1963 domain-containing protein [Alphaproteobacteria bacterium]